MAAELIGNIHREHKNVNDMILIDPCCGSGNLISAVISMLPAADRWNFLIHNVVLLDKDSIALDIASAMLICAYAPKGARTSLSCIKRYLVDFLSHDIGTIGAASANVAVIANPPYGRTDVPYSRFHTSKTKELYALFMERISELADIAVIVTPQSFLGSQKFNCLRDILAKQHDLEIYPYDNMPASLFCGRKHGVFNTNAANSVRAAISVLSKRSNDSLLPSKYGNVSVTPLMRWKAEERPMLFDASRSLMAAAHPLDGMDAASGFPKVPAPLTEMFETLRHSSRHISDLVTPHETRWHLDVPMTPRYFTSASSRPLDRSAKHVLCFPDEESMALAYLVINSSLAYGWWRAHDGGITITASLLMSVPVPDSVDVETVVRQMRETQGHEAEHIVTKLNAGRVNENLKLPASTLAENLHILLPGLSGEEARAFAAFHASDLATQVDAWA